MATSSPNDTSSGTFNTIRDVVEQDAAYGAHWPILKNDFDTLSDTVKGNEKTNIDNREDWDGSVEEIRDAFDKAIKEGDPSLTINPFD